MGQETNRHSGFRRALRRSWWWSAASGAGFVAGTVMAVAGSVWWPLPFVAGLFGIAPTYKWGRRAFRLYLEEEQE